MPLKRAALLAVSFFICSLSPALARQVGVLYGDRFSAGDLVDWAFREFPGGVGEMTWSGTEGQPPGSLRLTSENNAGVMAHSICIPFGGDQPWSATVDVMSRGGAYCNIDFVYHLMAACADSDQIGYQQQGPGTFLDGVWVSLERELLLDADPEANPVAAAMELRASGGGTCFFDNVEIRGTTPRSIPAVDPIGLVAFGLFLAVVGFLLARQR